MGARQGERCAQKKADPGKVGFEWGCVKDASGCGNEARFTSGEEWTKLYVDGVPFQRRRR
jgi:hypothetical protein